MEVDESLKPKGSLLGLDRLAAEKKKEKLKDENQSAGSDEPTSKRSKVYSYKTGEEETIDVDSRRSNTRNDDYDDRK